MEKLPIAFRPANDKDRGYLYKTWMIDFHKTYPTNFIPSTIYTPAQGAVIDSLLPNSNVIISHIDDEPDTIVGYLVYQNMDNNNIICHWGHTKGIFRRMGALTMLLEHVQAQDKNIVCTHMFNLFKDLKDKLRLIYDPTLLQELK